MSEQWYAIVDKATGRRHATGTVIADAKTLEDGGFEVVPLAFNPQVSPLGDLDGCYEWDAQSRAFSAQSGATTRLKRLETLRREEVALETEMVTKGETVPTRSR